MIWRNNLISRQKSIYQKFSIVDGLSMIIYIIQNLNKLNIIHINGVQNKENPTYSKKKMQHVTAPVGIW